MEIGLSLGSNVGARLENLSKARGSIASIDGLRILAAAPVYETDPVGVDDRYAHLPFLNTILIIETALDMHGLHQCLSLIELAMGRDRTEKNAPRVMDIDIIYAGSTVLHGPDLTIPHPRWNTRRFVVQPLADVRPDLVVPGQPKSAADILSELPEIPVVKLFSRDWQ